MAAKKIYKDWLQLSALRLTRIRFVVLAAFALLTVASDAWNLITPGSVLTRWMGIGVLLIANTLLWYASRNNVRNEFYYKCLIYAQIVLDIVVVSLLVYSQRGIASRAVLLYVIPIIASATLLTRSAVYATATLSSAAYALTAIRYQFLHPGEAYKVELYSETFFYGAMFLIAAALLQVVIRNKAK